jgi:hypothetical protein
VTRTFGRISRSFTIMPYLPEAEVRKFPAIELSAWARGGRILGGVVTGSQDRGVPVSPGTFP